MALIQPRINLASKEGVSMFLTAPGMEEIEVKVPPHDCKATDVIKYVFVIRLDPLGQLDHQYIPKSFRVN